MMDRDKITKLYQELREEKNQRWDRTLPFGDLLADRWEKAAYLGFGAGSSIYDSSIVMGDVSVGNNTWIGPNTILDGTGGRIFIGDGCDISAGVQIYTHDTVKRCLSGGKSKTETGRVTIGDCCYIAPMSLIAKGVSIGSHSVIAAHSLVKDSFDSHSIIAGIPAVRIGKVEVNEREVKLIYESEKEHIIDSKERAHIYSQTVQRCVGNDTDANHV